MAKVTPTTTSGGFNSSTIVNDNFTTLADELNNNVLYRNNPVGEPNQMGNDLDMDSNQLLNVGTGTQDSDGVNLGQAKSLLTERVNVVTNITADFSVDGLNDRGKMFLCSNTIDIVCTITADNERTDGSVIYITQVGGNTVSVVGDVGVTVNYPDGNTTRTQHSTIALVKTGDAEWLLLGDLGYYVV